MPAIDLAIIAGGGLIAGAVALLALLALALVTVARYPDDDDPRRNAPRVTFAVLSLLIVAALGFFVFVVAGLAALVSVVAAA